MIKTEMSHSNTGKFYNILFDFKPNTFDTHLVREHGASN